MGLQYYKPNKANKGHGAHFSFNSKGDRKGVFVEIVKQNGWDAAARNGQGNGIFKDGKKVNVKLSTSEVATIMNAVERREDVNKAFVHTSQNGTTTIGFKRFKGKVKNAAGKWEEGPEYTGYGLSVNKGEGDENRFGMSFSFGEAVELCEWLKFALRHIFSGIYSEDVKRAKEWSDKKAAAEGKAANKPKGVGDFVEGDGPPAINGDEESEEAPF